VPAPDVFVVGGSAGGIGALRNLLREIPEGFPASILAVLHAGADSPGLLDAILQPHSLLPVAWAAEGTIIRPGTVLLARPDMHLGVEDHRARVWWGPKENRHRPAIDVTMRSVAAVHGERAVGILLTGRLDDGTSGLIEIKRAGGTTIVQDPKEAEHPDMPQNAIRNAPVDYVLPLSGIAEALVSLASGRALPPSVMPIRSPSNDDELEISRMNPAVQDKEDREGGPSLYTCPDCGGSLWETRDGDLLRYRCRVGHAFTQATMAAGQSDAVERALSVALRTMQEKMSLSRRLGDDARRRGLSTIARIHESKTAEIEDHAGVVRELLRSTRRGPAASA